MILTATGWKHTEEEKRKVANALRGKKHTEEHRRHNSEARKGLPNHQLGRRRTAESKRKMSLWQIGKRLTEEHKRKISESSTGWKQTAEARQKISVAATGRRHTDATKKKLSEARMGKTPNWITPPWLGKKHSAATRRKMQKSRVGRQHTEETKNKIRVAHLGKPKLGSAVASSKIHESPQERFLHFALRKMRIKFIPHLGVVNRWAVDVYLPKYNLILEADGWPHTKACHWFDPAKQHARDRAIRKAGFKLQRLTNAQIEADPIAAVRWAFKKQRLTF
jgi:very-short-patch-repair endonuclease